MSYVPTPLKDVVLVETMNGHTFKTNQSVDFSKVFPLGYSESKGILQETYLNQEEVKRKGYKTLKETRCAFRIKKVSYSHIIMI